MEISDQSIAYVWQYPPTLRRNDLCQVFIFLLGGGGGETATHKLSVLEHSVNIK